MQKNTKREIWKKRIGEKIAKRLGKTVIAPEIPAIIKGIDINVSGDVPKFIVNFQDGKGGEAPHKKYDRQADALERFSLP